MDEESVLDYIKETFDGVEIVTGPGGYFVFYTPAGYPPDHRLPFATLMVNDDNDRASDLNRPSVFRLNIGVSVNTYRSLFGPQPRPPGPTGVVETGHDFTALDRLLPHPVYAPMSWVCILSPSEATFEAVRPLLVEAYDLAVKRHASGAGRA